MNRVLILGAGMVSRPIVNHFLGRPDCRLTVASLFPHEARALVAGNNGARALGVDVSDTAAVEPVIADCDVVISLVPYAFHTSVARLAIRHRVHMITASYASPEMRGLDDAARDAGVMLLNEVGLDPGLDHMSAMRAIDEIHARGGVVESFRSYTGSLPAPENADNPWRYKFSWSPRGALAAARNAAHYLEDGRVHDVLGEDLFDHRRAFPIEGVGQFEVYPNRDSLHYLDLYGIHEAKTMLRGTLRYPGWCDTMRALAEIGLLDDGIRRWEIGTTYGQFVEAFLDGGTGSLRERLARRLSVPADGELIGRLAWVGLLDSEPLDAIEGAPIDTVAALLQRKLSYAEGERDMVIMRHEFDYRLADGTVCKRRSQLLEFGEPRGDSATSRTVSLPAAIAATGVLEGRLVLPGVRIPIEKEIYGPILDGLDGLGLRFEEQDC